MKFAMKNIWVTHSFELWFVGLWSKKSTECTVLQNFYSPFCTFGLVIRFIQAGSMVF